MHLSVPDVSEKPEKYQAKVNMTVRTSKKQLRKANNRKLKQDHNNYLNKYLMKYLNIRELRKYQVMWLPENVTGTKMLLWAFEM